MADERLFECTEKISRSRDRLAGRTAGPTSSVINSLGISRWGGRSWRLPLSGHRADAHTRRVDPRAGMSLRTMAVMAAINAANNTRKTRISGGIAATFQNGDRIEFHSTNAFQP